MHILDRFVRFLTALLLWAAAAIFVFCVGFYGVEVFSRGFLNTSIPEYFEIVGIGFVYVFLLGAAALYGRDEDIIIGLLYDRVPLVVQKWWLLCVHALIAAASVVTAAATIRMIELQWTTPTALLGVPEATRWIPLAIASVSMALMAGCRVLACAVWLRGAQKPALLRPVTQQEDLMEVQL